MGCGSGRLSVHKLLLVVLSDGLRSIAAHDLDPARLQGLWDLTPQLNREQAVLQASSHHLHVIRQVEGRLEGAGCKADDLGRIAVASVRVRVTCLSCALLHSLVQQQATRH